MIVVLVISPTPSGDRGPVGICLCLLSGVMRHMVLLWI